MSVRVRYAPSPTGSPHVGNIRTALYDYLFARHNGGEHILRIEDTDRSRYVAGCEQEIEESLQWMGIEWDEGPDRGGPFGPYRQSERQAAGLYDPWVHKLLDSGAAYWAFDSTEELAEMREYQTINRQAIGYFGGIWRDASQSQVEQAQSEGKPGVVRLKMPRGRTLVCPDAIRGRIEFNSDTVDDPVLIKADGMPTYHFAAMVDDHLMEITHIIRGEEWISSAPKHVFLFEAFGWTPPLFVHVPVIKGRDGSKLSKRHGDTALLDFRHRGFLPEAMSNFIALIGWAPGGDRELMGPEDLIDAFTLEGLQPAPGVFDLDKLHWMNGHYIRQLSNSELVAKVNQFASDDGVEKFWAERPNEDPGRTLPLVKQTLRHDPAYVAEALALEQERVQTLADFGPAAEFFLVDLPDYDPSAIEKWFKEPHVRDLFEKLIGELHSSQHWDAKRTEALVRKLSDDFGFEKLGPVVHPIRIALTGKTVGPGLFELMAVLGPERMERRIRYCLEKIL